MLYENYEKVVENVKKACERSGRNFQDVTIIAVSKTKPLSDVEELLAHGITEFGENKVQEMVDKYEHVSKPVNWHLIGHLQTNKVKYIVDKACLIHSVDSVHLAKEIEKEAAKKDVVVKVLIEVNIAQEESKFGIREDEVYSLIDAIKDMPHVHVMGLMTIAPFVDNPEENRVYFRKMHQLLLDIKSKCIDNVDMNVLSMGMTNDYEIAVEEGATMIRVGTAIFGARNYNI
ncbi:YggS family pyridoxal phosphate-dependent enzyme [Eubacterium sp. MSJ-33]|uniref:YggS family pyridoxal phosphate-dependent enzyme n=1 Tax=Eubacterium sp. MSJ-33 TaxID=2841528 RepID=UPI001C769ABD|nr:YggS family pyridoxal phosphate-dependent enzyme [Eubacterium sp. MSJ-33]QWT53566.1 YggS family pyridoxal phosphate-dependent enzyme [Eubacterium sp. MSJ-33]